MGLTRIRAEQISDIDFKQAVRVVTTTDITLSGSAPIVVDGVTLAANNRVLVAGQTTASQNGIYVVTTLGTGSNGTWTRSTDANATGEIEAGMIVMVTDGTIYADTQWVLATNNPIVVGTTPLSFQQNITNTGNVSSGSSGIRVLANSNVLVSVSGTANVATFAVDGLYITGNITTGNLAVGNNVVITGNLTVNGTTTTINSNTITTNDKSITLANNQSTSANVDGAGIDVGNPSIATWRYSNATASWQSNVAITPAANAALALGGDANYWSTVYANTASLAGNVTSTGAVISTINATTISAAGNITGGNINTGSLSVAGNVLGSLLPAANVTYDLGSATQMWRTLYVSSNTVYIGNTALSTASGNLTVGNNASGGISATGAIINSSLGVGQASSSDGTFRLYSGMQTQAVITMTGIGGVGDISATGNISLGGGNFITSGNSNVAYVNSAGINATGNVNSARVSATGNITGGNLNAAGLSLSGNVFGNLTVTNIVTAGTLNSAGAVSAAGNVRATGWISATGNIDSGNNVNISGAITVTGNVNGGNINTGGNVSVTGLVSATGNITGSQFVGNGAPLTTLTGANVTGTVANATYAVSAGSATTAGTVTTAAQGNITSVGILTSLSVTGNVTGSNVTGTNLYGTLQTPTQLNVTSLGSLGSLTVIGNASVGNLTTSGTISAIGDINTAGNMRALNFNSAAADLAEMYVADTNYPPGTVVDFGGIEEITQTVAPCSTAIAGVISTMPSYLMNSGQQGKYVLPVALTGRVPCCVQGPVSKGDVLVSSVQPGVAQRIGTQYQPGCVIGKSLGYIDDASIQTIEVVVGRF